MNESESNSKSSYPQVLKIWTWVQVLIYMPSLDHCVCYVCVSASLVLCLSSSSIVASPVCTLTVSVWCRVLHHIDLRQTPGSERPPCSATSISITLCPQRVTVCSGPRRVPERVDADAGGEADERQAPAAPPSPMAGSLREAEALLPAPPLLLLVQAGTQHWAEEPRHLTDSRLTLCHEVSRPVCEPSKMGRGEWMCISLAQYPAAFCCNLKRHDQLGPYENPN